MEKLWASVMPASLGPEWGAVVSITVVLVAAFVLRSVLLRLIQRFFLALGARAPSVEERRRIETLARVLRHAVSLITIVVAVLVALNTVGVSIAPILGAAGVAGVAIGFGAQSLVKDFFTGVFLLVENQIRVGDVVEVAGKTGVVEELTLRRTKLRSVDGAVHYISNGLITTVTNFSTEFAFAVVDVGVSSRESIDRVYALMRETAGGMRQDDAFRAAIMADIDITGIEHWNDSTVTLRCRLKTVPLEQWRIKREFLKRLKAAFEHHGIAMPMQQTMLITDSSTTRSAPPAAGRGGYAQHSQTAP